MSLEIRGRPWSAVMTTRPGIANPVTNSSQTPMAYFALCVPVESANRGFNNWASCKASLSGTLMRCRMRQSATAS